MVDAKADLSIQCLTYFLEYLQRTSNIFKCFQGLFNDLSLCHHFEQELGNSTEFHSFRACTCVMCISVSCAIQNSQLSVI